MLALAAVDIGQIGDDKRNQHQCHGQQRQLDVEAIVHQRDGDHLADHGNPAQLYEQLHVLPLGQPLYAKQ